MKERTKHRRAFDQYVRLGPGRSLYDLYMSLAQNPGIAGLERGPSLSSIESWSSAFHWQDRLLDLEREARRRDEEEQVKALRDMTERHIKEGLALQQKGIERLNQLAAEDMTAQDAIRAVLEGVKLERLSRGEPTELIRQDGVSLHGHIDLSGFSNEELRRLAEFGKHGATGAGEAQPR
jgi:uncharacterized protein YoaH (UPF0181 family)